MAAEADRLPHIVVNYVASGSRSIKLGFMTRRGADETVKRQALAIKQRLEAAGCTVGELTEPGANEDFFWFLVDERPQPPAVRDLLASYGDVILR